MARLTPKLKPKSFIMVNYTPVLKSSQLQCTLVFLVATLAKSDRYMTLSDVIYSRLLADDSKLTSNDLRLK